MVLCAPLLAGWVTIGLSQAQVWIIYLGRILQGVGVMSSVTQVSFSSYDSALIYILLLLLF